MKENCTIVIPILFNSNKRWDAFSKEIFERLLKWNRNERLQWKKVCYFEKFDEKKYISDMDAFECDINKMISEEAYFYDEAYRTFYDSQSAASCMFMMQDSGREGETKTLLGESGISLSFGKYTRNVRKIYFYLTNAHIGLLIVELLEEQVNDETEIETVMNTEVFVSMKGNKKVELLSWALGDMQNDFPYSRPFKKKCFLALYHQPMSKTVDEKEFDIDDFQISNFIMKGKGSSSGVIDFFGHYFQIFWLCILQKVEILHISQMAGKISRKRNMFLMRSHITKVNKEYVLFYNQYDLVECTYHTLGEKLYRKIRETMSIERDNANVREQMSALHEYAMLVTGRMTNLWLTILSVVGTIVGIIEFFFK